MGPIVHSHHMAKDNFLKLFFRTPITDLAAISGNLIFSYFHRIAGEIDPTQSTVDER